MKYKLTLCATVCVHMEGYWHQQQQQDRYRPNLPEQIAPGGPWANHRTQAPATTIYAINEFSGSERVLGLFLVDYCTTPSGFRF